MVNQAYLSKLFMIMKVPNRMNYHSNKVIYLKN
ncbi:hypothetical protein BLA29_004011 [Euroglyphus maynei]|uniref:Uncharacterized protein n=1 Tax=Euroglyphus maynei TaxID=6958 RepID=A0A1Y3BH09_EURMA|nr:hypothetical protein BLA29_004011 [Euroglyphus maynei]